RAVRAPGALPDAAHELRGDVRARRGSRLVERVHAGPRPRPHQSRRRGAPRRALEPRQHRPGAGAARIRARVPVLAARRDPPPRRHPRDRVPPAGWAGHAIRNGTRSAENPEAFPYRVLCCALRSRAGRFIGLLVLLREAGAEPFTLRDAHIAEILGRKALGVIESSYDALSGLYTRPAFEQRVRGVVTGGESSQAWSALYVDVDQLHAINENAGMHVGDAVLAQLGELLRHRLPPGAFGSRISGDRFVVMLPAEVHD